MQISNWDKQVSKGRVTKVLKTQERTDCIIQGVSGQDQPYMHNNFNIRGSNGTYLEIGEYQGTKLYISFTLYNPPIFEYNNIRYQVPERITIDCYESVRNLLKEKSFNNLAIKNNRLHEIEDALEGNKFEFIFLSTVDNIQDGMLRVRVGIPLNYQGEFPFIADIFISPMKDEEHV